MKRLRESEDDSTTPARNVIPPRTASRRFKHSPLDLEAPSIRLVRVLPALSSSGYVQLDICHASTKSTYSCLSYVWGNEQALCWIKLGGRFFLVRQNLYAFLASARKKPHICSEWLWIDALCIDQSNNSERSHQVQQMGQIFSHAVKVISWLGDDERIAQFLRESTPPLSLDMVYPQHNRPGMSHFFKSDYWDRAWITQEVGLARSITFMAGNEEVDRWQPLEEKEADAMIPRNPNPVYSENYSHRWRGRSLVYLVELFFYKECHDRRDRIFSLLALCGEGSDLEVDYDISHDDLAERFLKACSNSFCFCTINMLDRVLDLGESDAVVLEQQSFGTLSLSISDSPYSNETIQLMSLDTVIGGGHPLAVSMSMPAICQSYTDYVYLTISPGTCYRVQETDDMITMSKFDCKIVLRRSKGSGGEELEQSVHGCSGSYDRDAQTWDMTFTSLALAQIAYSNKYGTLCTRGSGADSASVETSNEPILRMSSGSDLYVDAPDLSLPIPENPPHPSLQCLRSFKVRPYIDDDGESLYCGVFVYDREDKKNASHRSSLEESF
ncbi:hypothetical protein AA0112_g11455 [Alternaria arborescens]|nr:hypothetical protein AA0112_g11455 [Alternaria arborescens]